MDDIPELYYNGSLSIKSAQTENLEAIKHSLDQQIPQIKSIADTSKIQSEKTSEQVDQLKKIADSLQAQVDLATKDSSIAKRDAAFAKIISILSILIALISLFP